MKFRILVFFVMLAFAGIIGMYVISCTNYAEDRRGSNRQTSGSLNDNGHIAPSPDEVYHNEANRNLPADVAPLEEHIQEHEHEHEHDHGRPSGVMD